MMYSLLKETKTCQVCKKSFSNGKALGGHMRSHTLKLSSESATGSIPSSLTTFNKRGANFRPHETVLMRFVNTSEVVCGLKPNLNKEGEQQVTAERNIIVDLDKVSSTESQYYLTDEELAGYCLLQMKDNWPQSLQNPKSIDCLVSTQKRKDTENYIEIDSEEDYEGSYKYVDEDEDNEDGDVKFSTSYVEVPTEDNNESDDDDDDDDGDDYHYEDDEDAYSVAEEKKCKKKYVCDICGKVLRSHQALGGHRTSHGYKRLKISDKNGKATKPENGPLVRRHFECQICGKVFASGQALGGHKKVHYAFLQPTN